jgi:hypothetical protein
MRTLEEKEEELPLDKIVRRGSGARMPPIVFRANGNRCLCHFRHSPARAGRNCAHARGVHGFQRATFTNRQLFFHSAQDAPLRLGTNSYPCVLSSGVDHSLSRQEDQALTVKLGARRRSMSNFASCCSRVVMRLSSRFRDAPRGKILMLVSTPCTTGVQKQSKFRIFGVCVDSWNQQLADSASVLKV